MQVGDGVEVEVEVEERRGVSSVFGHGCCVVRTNKKGAVLRGPGGDINTAARGGGAA